VPYIPVKLLLSILTKDTEAMPMVAQTSSAIPASCALELLVSNNSAIPAAILRKLLERESATPPKMTPSM
jgi:hypothetical protein